MRLKKLLNLFLIAFFFSSCLARNADSDLTSIKSNDGSMVYAAWLDWTSFREARSTAEVQAIAERLVMKAERAGLNTIYLIAWRYGCAMFTKVMDGIPVCNRDIDYYGIVQETAANRARPIQVIPWIERPIGVGDHEPIFAKTKKWYVENDLLEGFYFTEAGFNFPVMKLDNDRVRSLLVNVTKSLVQNYNAKVIQFDDHLRLPKQQAKNIELQRKIIKLGIHWFSEIKNNFPNVTIEYAPLKIDFSISEYGTDWVQWKKYIDRIVLQCYKTTNNMMIDSNECHSLPQSVRDKFFGIGIYWLISGKVVDPQEIVKMAKTQIKRNQSFSIFTLDRLSNTILDDLNRVTYLNLNKERKYTKGKATAKKNDDLLGAHVRIGPKNLSDLKSPCKLEPGESIQYKDGTIDGPWLKATLISAPKACQNQVNSSLFMYVPNFLLDSELQ